MSKLKKPAIIFAVFLGTLLIFSAAILPMIVKNKVSEAIRQSTGRTVRIESVSINPFLLALSAKGVVVEENGGGPFVAFAGLRATVNPASIYKRALILEEVTLDTPSFSITRTAPDRYSFTDIIERLHAQKKPASQGTPLFSINNLTVTNGNVHFSDAVPKGGFKGSLNDINFKLKHFTTAANTPAEYNLSLLVDNEATLTSEGCFSVFPPAVKASTELAGLNLQKGWPYLARFLRAPLKGVLDLSGEVGFSKDNGLTAENGRLTLKNFSTRYGDNDGVEISAMTVNGAAFKQKENRLEVAEVRLTKGKVSLSREADGKFSVLSMLVPQPDATTRKTAPAQKSTALKSRSVKVPGGAKALSYRLKRLKMEKVDLLFRDKTRTGSPTLSLRDTSISLANLNGPRFTPAQLRFATTFGNRAPIKLSGDITPQPFHYTGDISIGRLPIRAFEEYFPEDLNVTVLGGYLDAALMMDIALQDGKPIGTFKGSSGVRAFHSIDKIAKEDLLKWESLQLDEFHGSLVPFILDVRKVALNGVYSRIIVRKDGTLNLQNLLQRPVPTAIPENKGPAPALPVVIPEATAADPSAAQPKGRSRAKVTIGTVTIQDGTASFSDTHMPLQFATTFYNLGGRVSGLSSEESRFADVDLRGNLENRSPLQITGKINPLRDDLFADLQVSFHDIELPPSSPYSGRYLGYTVEKGTMFLDLKYHIEKKLLTSGNKIFIDQLTLGDRVESDKATSLPVQLGLALLKDRKGEIHLDVPVTGRTDNPELRIWNLVVQVFKNLLVKAVTSPLSLLSSMFGSAEDFSAIQFDHGTSIISPREELKLNTLTKALLDRPALKLELKGYVDREKDSEAYRRELLDRKLRHEKYLTLGTEGTLEADVAGAAIQVLPEEYATYLAAVYKKEKFPKPRNVIGLIKNLPPDEMNKLIIANTIIGEHELNALARERVVAVMNHLVGKGHVPAGRIFQRDDDIFKTQGNKSISRSRVELNAVVQ